VDGQAQGGGEGQQGGEPAGLSDEGGHAEIERAGPRAGALARRVHPIEEFAVGGVGEGVGELGVQGAHGRAVEAMGGDAEALEGALDLGHHAGQGGALGRAEGAGDGQQEAVGGDVLAAQILLPPGAQTAAEVAQRGGGRVHVGEGAGHGRRGGGRRGEHGDLHLVGDRGREGPGRAVGERVEQVAGQAEHLRGGEFEPEAGVLALLGARAVVRDRDAFLHAAHGTPRPRRRPRRCRLRGRDRRRLGRGVLVGRPVPPEQRPAGAALRMRVGSPTHGR